MYLKMVKSSTYPLLIRNDPIHWVTTYVNKSLPLKAVSGRVFNDINASQVGAHLMVRVDN